MRAGDQDVTKWYHEQLRPGMDCREWWKKYGFEREERRAAEKRLAREKKRREREEKERKLRERNADVDHFRRTGKYPVKTTEV